MNSTRFLREFISKPGITGAVIPSTGFLAKAMVEGLNLDTAEAVLEYGPGTGIFTDYIARKIGQTTKFVAIEINPKLAMLFKAQHPQITLVEDSVANVRTICDSQGIHSVDCIVSSLPWAAFSESTQMTLLDATMTVLRPGGKFVTFGYLHSLRISSGKRFAEILPKYFQAVSKSPAVWMNIPPAFVYRCTK
jgi:phosphatidylethanolamine/phosphatidyl-N-methylethanolamine N-methyltransferase